MRGTRDSPASADWITIASVVLEPRAENGLRDVRVAIVGAGFGGIGTAIRLREAGYEDLVILERDEGLGGTWWANTYPGCACDVAAHLYSFSFALNPDWSRFFAPQAEILDYLRRVARTRGIEPLIRFGTEVTGARWDEHASRWRVETDRGALSAQVLVSAAGGLTEPKLPAVPGLDSFAGAMFHSARWDHGHDLSGERVGVIGTGSTASQIVPEVQKHAARLTVFQRSPGWVLPRLDHPHSDLQKLLLRRFPALQRAIRSAIYYNNELLILGLVRRPRLLAGLERLALGYLKRQVPNTEIRAKLTPDYRIGCKRIIISSDFLGTFMKPNVELVTEGIREIVPDGIVTQDGRKIELDTIVFATGFDVMNPPHFRHVVGRGGRSIRDVWDEHGIRAYLGTVIPGFPNHFVLLGPNTASGNNSALQPIEAQIGFAIDALRAMDAGRDGGRRAPGRHGALRRRDPAAARPDRLEQRRLSLVVRGPRRAELHDLARVRQRVQDAARAVRPRRVRADERTGRSGHGLIPAHIHLIRERQGHHRRAGSAGRQRPARPLRPRRRGHARAGLAARGLHRRAQRREHRVREALYRGAPRDVRPARQVGRPKCRGAGSRPRGLHRVAAYLLGADRAAITALPRLPLARSRSIHDRIPSQVIAPREADSCPVRARSGSAALHGKQHWVRGAGR